MAQGVHSYTMQVSRLRSLNMTMRADEIVVVIQRTISSIRWAATRMGPITTSLPLFCDMLVEDKSTRAAFSEAFGAHDLQQLRSVDLVMMHNNQTDVYVLLRTCSDGFRKLRQRWR